MPIGPFKDYDECVKSQISDGKSEDSAKKICGAMQRDLEAAFDLDKCIEQQKAKGKDDGEAQKICKFIEQRQGAFDLDKCLEQQKAKGKDDEAAKKVCSFIEKRFGQAEYTDQEKLTKDDFESVDDCVEHCMNTLDKTEEAANTFCTKLFDTPPEAKKSATEFDMEGCMKTKIDGGMSPEDAHKECMNVSSKVAEVKSKGRNETIKRYSQSNQSEDKLFVKAFLLDDSVNLNNWGVDPASIEHNINTFIGKPMVLTEKFDHPVVDDMSYGHALQYQDIYRIGTIIDIIKMSDKQKISPYGNSYYAIIEITNDAAKKAFQTGDLPLYVSPAIAQMELGEDPEKLQAWLALHLAVVDDPAYTVKKAMITGQCSGDQATCLVRLRQAHLEKHGYGKCGFCIYGKLTSVLTANNVSVTESGVTTSGTDGVPSITVTVPISQSTADNTEKITVPVELNNTSLESQNEHVQQVHSMENTNTNVADVPNNTAPTTETTQPVAVAPQTPAPATAPEVVNETTQNMIDLTKSGEGSDAILKAQYIQYKAEATILKEQKASLERKLADTQAELTTLKESLRKSQIASVVTEDLIADEKTREETIKFFMDAGLAPDQVKAVYENVGITKTASVNTGVQTPSYEPRMPLIRTAKKSSEHDVEAILGLADMIVKNDGGAV